ncbi:unnamed protein product [Arabidopsis lyrata]|uniref:probable leucine-rich repeat receptor-like protein kinase At5g49770 n=1 Tax=Arabidopsis lyrata subsp. lyrata TaxID=81972 RepID=UPI000A29B197|nr:probable leucine-rich repeat receptor-like protein kinase At5g49770 [Arabidopsis lyrata subsp. lyrata]CAH8263524.1 unnamed protein product [Arabidopsis lyrata]|eukprot:XP_020885445.1 probable leucine-rich repeat receptor-like protein kinase At5g49770 [Arabidopsis lyrata subsp. lyrata]
MEELRQATNNFDMANTIGLGSYGVVYTGLIGDKIVVIKREWCGLQPRFLAEVSYMSKIQHRNLVNLLGYCCDDENQLLVFEYMVNGSVRDYLDASRDLTFKKRISIALDAAKGLLHLHNLDPPVQHKRFTTSKVLLDADLNAKVSDPGMLGLLEARDLRLVNPRGGLAETIDVFSFGLFLLELITGEKPDVFESNEEIVQWILPRMFTRSSFKPYMKITLECLNYPAIDRPKMDVVVTELETIYQNEVFSEDRGVALGSELFNITIE